MTMLKPGRRVTGHRVTGSTGRVGSRVSVTDPVSDPVYDDTVEASVLASQAVKKTLI